jgi:hypothetical protein
MAMQRPGSARPFSAVCVYKNGERNAQAADGRYLTGAFPRSQQELQDIKGITQPISIEH